MTPALKARIMGHLSNAASKAKNPGANITQVVIPPVEAESVPPTEAEPAPPIEAEPVTPIEAPQPTQSILTDDPLGNQQPPPCTENPDDDMSDTFSFTSTLPEIFEGGDDDSAPLATGPWKIIDHFTGKMIVNNEELPPVAPIAPVAPVAPGAALDSAIQVEVILGTAVLVQTLPPTLLFVDQDVHPDWLIKSTNEFLQYMPYYMCLNKVVDLFFAQEANLGYPRKVSALCSSRLHLLTTLLFANHQSVRLALPSQNRPTEVAVFMKNARDFSHGDEVDAEKFGAKVLKWWLTIQPTTRKAWPPSYRPLPGDFSFEYFNRGGPNGVFLMILSFMVGKCACHQHRPHELQTGRQRCPLGARTDY